MCFNTKVSSLGKLKLPLEMQVNQRVPVPVTLAYWRLYKSIEQWSFICSIWWYQLVPDNSLLHFAHFHNSISHFMVCNG